MQWFVADSGCCKLGILGLGCSICSTCVYEVLISYFPLSQMLSWLIAFWHWFLVRETLGLSSDSDSDEWQWWSSLEWQWQFSVSTLPLVVRASVRLGDWPWGLVLFCVTHIDTDNISITLTLTIFLWSGEWEICFLRDSAYFDMHTYTHTHCSSWTYLCLLLCVNIFNHFETFRCILSCNNQMFGPCVNHHKKPDLYWDLFTLLQQTFVWQICLVVKVSVKC